jgi:hypothetical protein
MSAIDVGGFRSLLSTVSVATALILQHHDIEPPTPRNDRLGSTFPLTVRGPIRSFLGVA